MHQDTKSAWLIAVCKRTLSIIIINFPKVLYELRHIYKSSHHFFWAEVWHSACILVSTLRECRFYQKDYQPIIIFHFIKFSYFLTFIYFCRFYALFITIFIFMLVCSVWFFVNLVKMRYSMCRIIVHFIPSSSRRQEIIHNFIFNIICYKYVLYNYYNG